jgi:hypothetical protein
MKNELVELLTRALNEFSIQAEGSTLRISTQENLAEIVQSLVSEDDAEIKKISSSFLKSEHLSLALSIYLQTEHAGSV